MCKIGTGSPPPAGTASIDLPSLRPNRMRSPAPQVPWLRIPPSFEQILDTTWSRRLMRFHSCREANASDWPSGDQKMDVAESVPGSSSAVESDMSRTQIPRLAENANRNPSGDNAKNVRSGLKRNSIPSPAGTSMRAGKEDTDGPER